MASSSSSDPTRYEEFALVAEGGMGAVYSAHDRILQRRVALKVIRGATPHAEGTRDSPFAARDPSGVESTAQDVEARFRQEAWITARLEHPGVVPVYDLGDHAIGSPYYTMRLIQGGQTLQDALSKVQGASFEERLALLDTFVRLCDVVAFAHDKGVIHRDIKPANIALGSFGEVLLLDWGLARVMGQPDERAGEWEKRIRLYREEQALNTLSSAMGTPGYMSLEAAGGGLGEVTQCSDVYSLGVVLHEMLTGELPVKASNFLEYVEALREDGVRDPRQVESAVPDDLAELCAAMLSRDPASRPEGAGSVGRRVRGWLQQRAIASEASAHLRVARELLNQAVRSEGHESAVLLDRAALSARRAQELLPSEDARQLIGKVEARRGAAVEQQIRASRRRTLRRTLAIAAVLTVAASIVVSSMLASRKAEAEEAARKARARSAQFDALATFVMDRVQQDLANTADLDALGRLGKGVLASLKSGGDDADSAELDHLRAYALGLRASVALRRANPSEAIRLYEEALMASRRPRDRGESSRLTTPALLAGLAIAHQSAGDLAAADQRAGEALALIETSRSGDTRGPRAASIAQHVLRVRATIWSQQGQKDRAKTMFERIVGIRDEQPSAVAMDPGICTNTVAAFNALAILASEAGRLPEAARHVSSLEALATQMAEQMPGATSTRFARATWCRLASQRAASEGRVNEARELTIEAERALAELVSRDPDNAAWALARASLLNDLGGADRRGGRHGEATTRYEEAIRVLQPIHRRNPMDSAVARGLAGAHEGLGQVLRERRLFEQATRHYDQGLAIRATDPAVGYDADAAFGVAVVYEERALCKLQHGLAGQALEDLELSVALLDGDLLRGCQFIACQRLRGIVHARLAEVCRTLGDPDRAERHQTEALARGRSLLEDAPDRADLRMELAVHLSEAAQRARLAGRKDKAKRLLLQSLDTLKPRIESVDPAAPELVHAGHICHSLALLVGSTDFAEREAWLRKALVLRKRSLSTGVDAPQWSVNVAASEIELAVLRGVVGARDEGVELIQSAITRLEALHEGPAVAPTWTQDLVTAYDQLADWRLTNQQWEELRQPCERALVLLRRIEGLPVLETPPWLWRRARIHYHLGVVAVDSRKAAEALHQFRAAAALLADESRLEQAGVELRGQLPVVLRLCTLVAGERAPEDASEHRTLAGWYGEGKDWERAVFHYELGFAGQREPPLSDLVGRMRAAGAAAHVAEADRITAKRKAQVLELGLLWMSEVATYAIQRLMDGQKLTKDEVQRYAALLDWILSHPEIEPLRSADGYADVAAAAKRALGR